MQEAKVSIAFTKNTEKNIVFDYELVPFNRQSIIRQQDKFPDRMVMYLDVGKGFPIVERVHNTGITDSWFIASDCFLVQQYPATILFAAIAVESALNHDSRLYDLRQENDGWIALGKAIEKAKNAGIDVSDLVDEKDQLEFVTIRNKIAHGNLTGYTKFQQTKIKDHNDIDEISKTWRVGEDQALKHLKTSFYFLKKWAEKNPTLILDENERISFG